MQHVLLTRFNVKLRHHQHGDTHWTDDRLDLFERTLHASMLGQTTSDFTWLVFFDDSTTPEQRARVSRLSDGERVFTPVYISEVFDVAHVQAELARRWSDVDYLLTSRVDNDDSLARDFMATVRSHAEGLVAQAPVFLNPTYGVQFDGRLLYTRPWPWNAFISLLEPGREPMSVFIDQHYSLGQYAKCLEIGSGEALWLQNIHGGNLANRVNGVPLRSIDAVTERFSLELEATPAGVRDLASAFGRIGYRAVRHPSKLRGPARVIGSRITRLFKRLRRS
jgi:hypothetical protein